MSLVVSVSPPSLQRGADLLSPAEEDGCAHERRIASCFMDIGLRVDAVRSLLVLYMLDMMLGTASAENLSAATPHRIHWTDHRAGGRPGPGTATTHRLSEVPLSCTLLCIVHALQVWKAPVWILGEYCAVIDEALARKDAKHLLSSALFTSIKRESRFSIHLRLFHVFLSEQNGKECADSVQTVCLQSAIKLFVHMAQLGDIKSLTIAVAICRERLGTLRYRVRRGGDGSLCVLMHRDWCSGIPTWRRRSEPKPFAQHWWPFISSPRTRTPPRRPHPRIGWRDACR